MSRPLPPADAWIAAEPRLLPVVREVLARAARRRVLVLLTAAALTAALAGLRVVLPGVYDATVTFRIEEGSLSDPARAVAQLGSIRDSIRDAAFTRARLLALIDRYGLTPRMRQANPVAAVDALREEIGVEVVRNYFVLDRESAGGPRSARIVLSYQGRDRQQAQAIVHDLAQLFLSTQEAGRAERLQVAREAAELQLHRGVADLQDLQGRRALLLLAQARGNGRVRAAVAAELPSLQGRIEDALLRSQTLRRRAADLEFAAGAEAQHLWLSLTQVDERVEALRKQPDSRWLAIFSALVFSVILPFTAVVLGAFDRRLYCSADVEMHGIPVLAVLPWSRWVDAAAARSRPRWSGGGAHSP